MLTALAILTGKLWFLKHYAFLIELELGLFRD